METRRALLLLSFAIVFSISVSEVLSFRLSDHKWKYFVFSQWWPQSQCYYKGDAGDSIDDQSFRIVNEYKFKNDCVPSYVDSWTIHGLWPTLNGTPFPHDCNGSWPFDIDEIGDLRSKMMMKWIALPDVLDSEHLWKHEWEKHGTCASSLPAVKNEHAYFSKALSLNAQSVDLLKMLEGKGLSPSDDKTYELVDIEDAIKKEYGVEGRVICLKGPDGYQYLAGIRICLDKTFKLIDCRVTYPERCIKRKPLKYPVIIRKPVTISTNL